MPTLPSSGPLSINDIKNVMGGPASPSLANYYRGGAYVPSQKTVTVNTRSPSSGEYYQYCCGTSRKFWYITNLSGSTTNGNTQIYAPDFGFHIQLGVQNNLTSYTTGNRTYYRGSLQYSYFDGYYQTYENFYSFYWVDSSTSTVNINTNVPTSGQISISQFYGAEKP